MPSILLMGEGRYLRHSVILSYKSKTCNCFFHNFVEFKRKLLPGYKWKNRDPLYYYFIMVRKVVNFKRYDRRNKNAKKRDKHL